MTLEGNKKYRAFMDQLAMTNVDKHVNLPTIAVMRDTSSGKSSLLSSISMAELPSAFELTTRCPIMLQMSNAKERSATVTVQWKDTPTGKTGSEISFAPESIDESDWNKLSGIISKAQKHIMDISRKEVARDVVVVQVAGPHCEDLRLMTFQVWYDRVVWLKAKTSVKILMHLLKST